MVRRVAYVVNVFPKLSETFIANELAEVRRRGIEVRILSLRRPEEALRHDLVDRAGLLERTTYDREAFGEVLREFRPELLHAHFMTRPAAMCRDLGAALGIPFTVTTHGYDIYRRPPDDFGGRAAAAGALITVSRANAAHIEDRFGVPIGNIDVIPCGVDTKLFRPLDDASHPGDTPLVVCVARLKPYKNQHLLLEACAILRHRGHAFRCVLVGEGPSRDDLEQERDRLGLHEVVLFTGAARQYEVLAWWRRGSIAVLTSDTEGMPVSLMEAAACGLPAVATSVGGVPELIQDGVTGLLIPPRDVDALADAMERLLKDRELRARFGRAARRRAVDRFSLERQVDRLVEVWGRVLASRMPRARVTVEDPYGVTADPTMPEIVRAIDPEEAAERLGSLLLPRIGEGERTRLKAIQVLRHKPGRRCVVQYDVEIGVDGRPAREVALIGKLRVGRPNHSSRRMLKKLRRAGFGDDSADGISVPEPIGIVPEWSMWLQRKVPGPTATGLLEAPEAPALMGRIAEAAHKLHRSGVPSRRRHGMREELEILGACFDRLAGERPGWSDRLAQLHAACHRLAAGTPGPPAVCGIHRDYYSDQVVIDGDRLYLIDFDLYCMGDPALDIGNFLGHVTEHALRTTGDPAALAPLEEALEVRFLELAGSEVRARVRSYANLTLARHVYLSTFLPGRREWTEPLFEICEERLGVGSAVVAAAPS